MHHRESDAADATWRTSTPNDLMEWLAALTVPWWIAGGWALDLFVGQVTRAHADMDVGILRQDALNACAALSEWEFYEATGGALTRLVTGHMPHAGVNSLWCRRLGESQWGFELMLDDCAEDRWVFRRDPAIQRALNIAIRRSPDGIPYLAPEIQLLYKAKATRTKDRIDFDEVAGRLDGGARAWLRASIARMDPSHAWLLLL